MQTLRSLFVDDNDFSSYLNHDFTIKRDDFKNNQIAYLCNKIKGGNFSLNFYYVVGDFPNHDTSNKNFGVLFLWTIKNWFMLYLIYVEVFMKVFFNNANIFTDNLLVSYFFEKIPLKWQMSRNIHFIFLYQV